jgi:23S rRNA (guanosine2251-2'-O)-methyltransferase
MKKLTHSEIASQRLKPQEIAGAKRLPLIALIDSVRSLYNVGSIFRTSDGAFVEKLILTGFTPHPPRKEIEKTALGSTLSVPWEYHQSPLEPILRLRGLGYRICCLELTHHSRSYHTLQKNDFPLCLIVGNEIAGVSREVLELCDLAFEIPMYGTKQSLNVAVAYGIAAFECSRVWRDGQSNARV